MSDEIDLSKPVKEVKKQVRNSENVNLKELLKKEKDGKNRSTLTKFLEKRIQNTGQKTDSQLALSKTRNENNKDKNFNNPSVLTIGVRQAVILSFLFGLVTGLLLGTMMFAAGGLSIEAPTMEQDAGNGESGEPAESGTEEVDEDLESISGMPYDVNTGVGSENVEWNGETVELEGRPYMGDDDADVIMVSYEDFFCPFCTAFHNEEFAEANQMNSAFGDIVENHIKEGEVQYYYKNLPVVGGDQPAEALECTLEHGDTEAFWDFNYEHFQNFEQLQQLAETDPSEYDEVMISWAEQLEMDADNFETCLLESEKQNDVIDQAEEAESLGASSTPSVFVNGELIEGAQPYSAFETVIDEQLE